MAQEHSSCFGSVCTMIIGWVVAPAAVGLGGYIAKGTFLAEQDRVARSRSASMLFDWCAWWRLLDHLVRRRLLLLRPRLGWVISRCCLASLEKAFEPRSS